MTDEEMDKIVDRVSRNVYNIVLELGWHYIQIAEEDMGAVSTPTYEEAVRDPR